VPGQAWAALIGGLILIGGFTAVVVPLLTGGGAVRGEVAGVIPGSATLGTPLEVPVAVDNTSGSTIAPVCVAATFDRPVHVTEARFQGLDIVPFHDGRACGGRLSGQETVSVVLVLVPAETGTVHVTLAVAEGSRVIGPPLRGTINVAPRG
jgi:hypothetical protein